MAIPHDSLQPAHDKLRDIWHISSAEEERLQEVMRNIPDPVFKGGQPDPVREDAIRTFEIVRAHRRYTRSCIDALGWGEQVDFLAHPQDKAKAERTRKKHLGLHRPKSGRTIPKHVNPWGYRT